MTEGVGGIWGANIVDNHSVRFRVWSPDGRVRGVRVDGRERAMVRQADGWCEVLVPGIGPGARYRFVLEDGTEIADPASRAQAEGVFGHSVVTDPTAYEWEDHSWRGRPWEETIYYELHVGTFTPEGTFQAAARKLEHLAALGITVIELMPVAQFGGTRGWGYDGVLPYAPHDAYGRPDDLKAFVDRAHQLGLGVVLDVVYNHFGPEGNPLPAVAPEFFDGQRNTPWGAAIAYENPPVRQFFIDNALYWLGEFHFDGLRLDAIDQVRDERSKKHILVELAETIRGRVWPRSVLLTTEDARNITALHQRDPQGRPLLYDGEWNDDFHNVAHAIATGETEGYYADFADHRSFKLARCLAEGFAFQGEVPAAGDGEPRGEPSAGLPPTAFVDFIQNHDQVGNRAFGERLRSLAERGSVETLLAMLLLSPHIPLLFMGEEWGERRPFAFFTDFSGDLADAVRDGRRREFAHFPAFRQETNLEEIPDPNAYETFAASRINWEAVDTEDGRSWLQLTKRLLQIRRESIVPLLAGAGPNAGSIEHADDGLVAVSWVLDHTSLHMVANLDSETHPASAVPGTVLYSSSADALAMMNAGNGLPAHSIVVSMRS